MGVFSNVLSDLVLQAARVADLEAIGIDMPIGLPDSGRRAADVLARSIVGPRWQSVFMTPVRSALAEESHAAASLRNKELAGEGISQQAYALRPRLFEVNAWVAASQIPVVEVHPEVSFATLAGRPLPHGKKSWAGSTLRRSMLVAAGIAVPDDLGALGESAAMDDVLDAAVAAWSAQRHTEGVARSFPDPPEVFSDGHHCAIWA